MSVVLIDTCHSHFFSCPEIACNELVELSKDLRVGLRLDCNAVVHLSHPPFSELFSLDNCEEGVNFDILKFI